MLTRRGCSIETAAHMFLTARSSCISWREMGLLIVQEDDRSISIALAWYKGFCQSTRCTYLDRNSTPALTKSLSHTRLSPSQPRSHSIFSNIPSQPGRSRNRPNHHPPSRNSNLLIRHPNRELPSQEPQRIQAMESKYPSNPELDRRLYDPR
jgi:hypothetical protein